MSSKLQFASKYPKIGYYLPIESSKLPGSAAMGNHPNARKKRTNAKTKRTDTRKKPRTYSAEELKQLKLDQDRYVDDRVAELLNHDPELLQLYHYEKQWRIKALILRGNLIELVESAQIGDQVQALVRNHKNVIARVREFSPEEFLSEGVACDCAEAVEAAAEALSALAVDIRKRISELPPLEVHDVEQWRKVERVSVQARMESFRKLDSIL